MLKCCFEFLGFAARVFRQIVNAVCFSNQVSNLPGGLWAERGDADLALGLSALGAALLSLACPAAAAWGGWRGLCAAQGLNGLAQGATIPAAHVLIARWVPKEERGALASIILSGI